MLLTSRRNRFTEERKLDHRIYFVGAHCTGKTALSSFMAKKLDLPYIEEQARATIKEKKLNLAELRLDMCKAAEFQAEIWKRQREKESQQDGSFISDRGFDNIAYAAHTSLIARELHQSIDFREYVNDLQSLGSIVFFVRPQESIARCRELGVDDDWTNICQIDGMIECILEIEGIPYIPLESLSMKSRVRTVEGVMHAAGVPYYG